MRAVLNLSLFIAAAVSVFAATSGLEPVPDFYAPKLAALQAAREPVDTLYFGSSRVHRGVMPRVVDAELARLGHERHSFNMAMIAMRPHEVDFYLRRVLAAPPPGLKTVVVELGVFTPTIRAPNRYTPRPIFWHDPYETRSVMRSAALLDASLPERVESALMHALHFGARQTGLGVLPRSFTRWMQGPDPELAKESRALVLLQGFRAFKSDDETRGVAGVNRKSFLDDIAGYRAEVARLPAENAGPGDLAHYNVEAVREQVRHVREAGLEIVYLIAPGIEPSADQRRLQREGVAPVLFAFDDPDAYPALYQPGHRFDRRHLDTTGAKLFSTLLARRLAAHWDRGSD